MRVTIEFSNGDKFGAAFSDNTSIDDIVNAVRETLEQQAEAAARESNGASTENLE